MITEEAAILSYKVTKYIHNQRSQINAFYVFTYNVLDSQQSFGLGMLVPGRMHNYKPLYRIHIILRLFTRMLISALILSLVIDWA